VLDRNRNRQIDDGLELFGTATDQPASDFPHGFRALAMFDKPGMGGNGDGKLTAADSYSPICGFGSMPTTTVFQLQVSCRLCRTGMWSRSPSTTRPGEGMRMATNSATACR
jgi:hypothetical protein